MSGTNSVHEGFCIYQKAKNSMNQVRFNLCKWKTNYKTLQQKTALVEDDKKATDAHSVKLLGVNWDVETDEF